MNSPIGKKLFHLVVSPGPPQPALAWCPLPEGTPRWLPTWYIILDELVDEEVEILVGFDEEEDINVVAASSTVNSLNNPEQTTQRYVKSTRNGSHHF